MIYIKLFLTFLEIGAFTFGGGYAMLPLIQEKVAANGWLTNEELINFIAVSESTPGPFAINVSTYVGMETGGIFGSFCATLGVVLPSFVIILVIAKFFEKFQNNKWVKGCMSGLKPAVVGLIMAAIVSTGKTVFFPNGFSFASLSSFMFIASVIIFVVTIILALKKVHPIIIIGISAVFGIIAGYLQNIIKL